MPGALARKIARATWSVFPPRTTTATEWPGIPASSGPSPSLIRMFIRSKPERDETAPRIASAAQSPRACAADAIRFRRAVSVSPA